MGQNGGQPLLEVRGIGKRFGAVTALDDVSAAVTPGEILALAGENGSGKSTLAKIMSGVLGPDRGEIVLDGTSTSFSRPRAALDAGIAIVTQELTAVPSLSVAENVLLPQLHRYTSRVSRRDMFRRARRHLETVGLRVDPATPFGALAPGQREVVEIAKALASDPRVLILDEATTRLPDPEALFALLERLAESGQAIVFITQRLREIRRIAHRAVVLRDGQVAGTLARHELGDEELTRLMVGRPLNVYEKRGVRLGEARLRVEGLVTDRARSPISLEARAGEVVGVAGLVGSGRSELLETIAGARRHHAGRVLVDGATVGRSSPRRAMRAGVGLLPEDRRWQGLVLGHSIARNLAMGSWSALKPARRADERSAAYAAIDRLRIRAASPDVPVGALSGGNQQKVVIGRCLARGPRVLLLDEPTRGVDVGVREEIYWIIDELAHEGTAVLMASSDLPELLAVCDRILVLNEGALTGELSSAEATEERILLLAAGHLPAREAA